MCGCDRVIGMTDEFWKAAAKWSDRRSKMSERACLVEDVKSMERMVKERVGRVQLSLDDLASCRRSLSKARAELRKMRRR